MEEFSSASWFILDASNTIIVFISIFLLKFELRTKRNIIFATLSSIIFGLIDMNTNGMSTFLFIITYGLLYIKINPKTKLIPKINILLITFFNALLAQGIASYLVIEIFKLNFNSSFEETTLATILLMLLNYLIDILFILIIKKVFLYILSINYINKDTLEKLILISISIITVSFSALLFVSGFLNTKLTYLRTSLIITATEIIFIVAGCVMFIKGYLKELKTKYDVKRLKDRNVYIKELERKNTELRRFKHDYKNLLASLSVSLKTDNPDSDSIQKLLNYADSNIDMTSTIENANLYHLTDDLIKGIIVTKLATAKNKHIDINFEIDQNIIIPTSLSVKITRILGILFDNAIEASLLNVHPKIEFALVSFDDYLEFIMKNNIDSNEEINLNKIFQTSYTSKKDHSGLGLSTVKEIIRSNSNLLLQTKIEENYFLTILTVLKNK